MPISRIKLHNQEERIKHATRDQLSEVASFVEIFISVLVVIGLLVATVPVITSIPELLDGHNEETFNIFLEEALNLVIGTEFIKMLAKHSPGSALEVLLYAIARHMVLNHTSAVDNLVGVASIALIFIIRKYLFVPSFGGSVPDAHGAQAAKEPEKPMPDNTPQH